MQVSATRPVARSTSLMTAIAVCVGLALVLSVGVSALMGAPSRGPIPDAAFKNGTIDRTLVPDFIPALSQAGETVGWVTKDQAIPVDGAAPSDLIPVFADDLKTIVGHMVADIGFVPLGVKPESLDTIPRPVITEEPVQDDN